MGSNQTVGACDAGQTRRGQDTSDRESVFPVDRGQREAALRLGRISGVLYGASKQKEAHFVDAEE